MIRVSHLLFGAVGLASIASMSLGAVTIRVGDAQINGAGTGQIDVWIELTDDTLDISSFNMGLLLDSSNGITFTGAYGPTSSAHPVVQTWTYENGTANLSGSFPQYANGYGLGMSGDGASPAAVQNGISDGLFSFEFLVDAGTLNGVYQVTIDPMFTYLDGQQFYTSLDNGSITVVPEPAAVGLMGLVGSVLALRRRRRA